jgi:hypothetical protein
MEEVRVQEPERENEYWPEVPVPQPDKGLPEFSVLRCPLCNWPMTLTPRATWTCGCEKRCD